MKSVKSRLQKRLSQNGDIQITIKTRHIVKFFRYLFGRHERKRQQKINADIESNRLKHIEHQHRLAKDRWRG